MIVVWIVFFAILIVSFITGIIITFIEEKKTSSFVVLDRKLLPDKIKLVQTKIAIINDEKLEYTNNVSKIYSNENVEQLSLEKRLVMKPVDVKNLENTINYDTPILINEFDEEII